MDSPIFEKKNVLVTGGAGFIGSHLCEKLLREANVICLDDFSNSTPENINHLLQYPDFEFINVDVNQPFDLSTYAELDKFKIKFQGIQELYHLACPTSPADFERLKMKSLLANSAAMINTLDVAVKYRAKYVFASSSVVYGSATPEKFTFKEDDQGIVDHLSPRACYDEGKRFGETCVATYTQVHGIDAKIARIFTTYGPHMRLFEGQPIIDLIVSALENKDVIVPGGEQDLTTLCYVSDMVDGLIALMGSDASVKTVNIGGDTIIKTMDVAKQIVALTGSTSTIAAGEELSFVTHPGVPDLYRVKNNLGWFPLVTLEQGLQKTIEYAVANKQALLYTHFDKLGR